MYQLNIDTTDFLALGRTQYEPSTIVLHQNYPNPFNPVTVIRFRLSVNSNVMLKVYNVLGQEVASLVNNEEMDEGEYEIEWDASAFPSGVYYYRLSVGSLSGAEGKQVSTQTKKLLLLK